MIVGFVNENDEPVIEVKLTIISFDVDFDRTERGRKMPKDLLEG